MTAQQTNSQHTTEETDMKKDRHTVPDRKKTDRLSQTGKRQTHCPRQEKDRHRHTDPDRKKTDRLSQTGKRQDTLSQTGKRQTQTH